MFSPLDCEVRRVVYIQNVSVTNVSATMFLPLKMNFFDIFSIKSLYCRKKLLSLQSSKLKTLLTTQASKQDIWERKKIQPR